MENSGEYDCTLETSPGEDIVIECIIPFARGFIVGCSNGLLFAYEKVEDPSKEPFQLIYS